MRLMLNNVLIYKKTIFIRRKFSADRSQKVIKNKLQKF